MGVYHEFFSIVPLLVRAPEGGVMILNNPYKTINNKARMPIFSVGGIYHNGSMHSIPISTGAKGGSL